MRHCSFFHIHTRTLNDVSVCSANGARGVVCEGRSGSTGGGAGQEDMAATLADLPGGPRSPRTARGEGVMV